MQECARCKKLCPIGEFEGCFITCKECRIKDYSKGRVRFNFVNRRRYCQYRKPLHLPDQWDGSWDNARRLQEETTGELP